MKKQVNVCSYTMSQGTILSDRRKREMEFKMADPVDVHVGKRIRERRLSSGMSQVKLAEISGVRFQQIQKYELGINRVSASRLWKISKALHVPISYFFDGLDTGA